MEPTKWLDAEAEQSATLNALPSCLSLCDLRNDNYYKLIAADFPNDFRSKSKLRVYKGTTMVTEQTLPGITSAVETFYAEEYEPKVPVIAVAIGPSILFYRNMKPYYKYTLPSLNIEPLERDIWRKLPIEKPELINGLVENLKTIGMEKLTIKSQKLIHLTDEKRIQFIKDYADIELVRPSVITVMTTIKRTTHDPKSAACLVFATESGDVYVLDAQTFSIIQEARICPFKATPSLISVSGLLSVDYRIVITTREGTLCILRKGWLEGRQIARFTYPASGLVLLPIDQTIVVVCMNNLLECYSKKGKKLWSVDLPSIAICMVPVTLSHLGLSLVCIALDGGIIQIYLQKNLVDQFTVPDRVSAMTFGRLGQEDHVLVLVTEEGSLMIKILKRKAQFAIDESHGRSLSDTQGSTDELQIPKKTKIFIEQTIRERENATEIYQTTQAELWRMRLTVARATVDVINSADSTLSDGIGHAAIKLAAEILGSGPEFTLKLKLENISIRKEASHLAVLLHANQNHYALHDPYVRLPPLIPSAPINLDFRIGIVMHSDGLPPSDLSKENSVIRVMVIKNGQAKPLIAASVSMPDYVPVNVDYY